MKKYNVVAIALFLAAFVAGSFIVGAGARAQVTTTSSAPLACQFTLPSVPAGTAAVLSATGGTGAYTWSSPGLVISNPIGTQFTVTFNAAGTYPVTVRDAAGATATCHIVVTGSTTGTTGGTTTGTSTGNTPGLPNTGEKFGA